jgi:Protein of unknown function (DUF2690)
MRIMRRKAIGIAISTVSLLAATSALTLSTAGIANAATYDNQWPDDTGCSSTAVTVRTTSTATALLELRYSTACRTVWARLTVHPNALIKDPQCWVVRNSDGKSTAGIVKITSSGNGTIVAFSEMLNDANVTSYAAADWTTVEGHHTAHTGSY